MPSVRNAALLAATIAGLACAAVMAVFTAQAFVPFERADLNDDGKINAIDQLRLAMLWQANDLRADLNDDGRINSIDQLGLAVAYMEARGIVRDTPTPGVVARDPLLWPYSPTSPWNMPIGSGAVYVSPGLPSTFMAVEDEIIAMQPGAPLRPVILRNQGNAACDGSTPGGTLPVPDGLITDLTSETYRPNNSGAFVLSDGRNVREGNWAARCNGVGPLYWGIQRGTHSLHGDGVSGFIGGHGGSGLTALGGSLRRWEILSEAPIRHALKFTISAQFLSPCDDGDRWPAQVADTGFNVPGATMEYKGTVCALRMGSLLALPPSVNCDVVVSDAFARRICWTLQNYGGYVVDSGPSWWQPHVLNVELGGNDLVEDRYGSAFTAGSLQQQMLALMTRLSVVDNNSPTSPGGGGTPRQPLAPALSN